MHCTKKFNFKPLLDAVQDLHNARKQQGKLNTCSTYKRRAFILLHTHKMDGIRTKYNDASKKINCSYCNSVLFSWRLFMAFGWKINKWIKTNKNTQISNQFVFIVLQWKQTIPSKWWMGCDWTLRMFHLNSKEIPHTRTASNALEKKWFLIAVKTSE